jgi:hypothetical protein
MREKQNKETFIARLNKDIEVRKELHKFYLNHFMPNVKKFDGKVFNKRFNDALCLLPAYTSIKYEKRYEVVKDGSIDYYEAEIRMYHSQYCGYCASLYVRIIVNEDGRIDYERTLNDDRSKHWLNGFLNEIKEHKDAVKNYDKYLKRAEKLEEEIKKFSDEVPYTLRDNFMFLFAYRLNRG